MARDYKHRATSRKRRKQVSPWLGMTVGLLVGLFVAFLVYIKMLAPKTPGLANGTDAGIAETAPSSGNDAEAGDLGDREIDENDAAAQYLHAERDMGAEYQQARNERGKDDTQLELAHSWYSSSAEIVCS
jgi:hypothetical protein